MNDADVLIFVVIKYHHLRESATLIYFKRTSAHDVHMSILFYFRSKNLKYKIKIPKFQQFHFTHEISE